MLMMILHAVTREFIHVINYHPVLCQIILSLPLMGLILDCGLRKLSPILMFTQLTAIDGLKLLLCTLLGQLIFGCIL